jgi:hypothetical protein
MLLATARAPRVRHAAAACRACSAAAAAAPVATAHQLAALALWLRARGVDLSRCRFARTGGAGAGLVAARDVAPGATLLSLPLETCAVSNGAAAASWTPVALTSEQPLAPAGPLGALGRALAATDAVARLSEAAPGLRSGRAYDATHAALLAAALLQQRGAGAAAHWAAYVAALPPALHAPALWSAHQLRRLTGSPVAAAAAARAAAVSAAHAALAPALAAAELPPQLRTHAAFAWAHATVLARAFDVPSLGLLTLAPGLDLCNHAGGAHVASVALEGESSAARTAAGRAGSAPPALALRAGAAGAAEGEALTHCYAGATAGEALLEFGFVHGLITTRLDDASLASPPPPAMVLLDLEPLLLGAAGDVAPAALRLAALHAAGLSGSLLRSFEASSLGIAQLGRSAGAGDAAAGEAMLPRRALAAARALVATADELAACAAAGGTLRAPISAAAEARATAALLHVVRSAQRAYALHEQSSSPLEGDDALRARLADAVVHGERRVMQALEAALELRRARALAGACVRDDDDDDAAFGL